MAKGAGGFGSGNAIRSYVMDRDSGERLVTLKVDSTLNRRTAVKAASASLERNQSNELRLSLRWCVVFRFKLDCGG